MRKTLFGSNHWERFSAEIILLSLLPENVNTLKYSWLFLLGVPSLTPHKTWSQKDLSLLLNSCLFRRMVPPIINNKFPPDLNSTQTTLLVTFWTIACWPILLLFPPMHCPSSDFWLPLCAVHCNISCLHGCLPRYVFPLQRRLQVLLSFALCQWTVASLQTSGKKAKGKKQWEL